MCHGAANEKPHLCQLSHRVENGEYDFLGRFYSTPPYPHVSAITKHLPVDMTIFDLHSGEKTDISGRISQNLAVVPLPFRK
jgi:hypothetical protein